MHDVAWHHEVNCVRSKDAQKQLARTSLSVLKIACVTFSCVIFVVHSLACIIYCTHYKLGEMRIKWIAHSFCFVFYCCLWLFSPLFTDIFKEGVWKETAAFDDPYLQGLASRLQRSVLSARAPATTNMYHQAFKKWQDFALSKFKNSFFPANPVHVAVIYSMC